MIKELFHWVWELVKDLFTFKWKYLIYDIQNLYWYLIYGFTYSDIQDIIQGNHYNTEHTIIFQAHPYYLYQYPFWMWELSRHCFHFLPSFVPP